MKNIIIIILLGLVAATSALADVTNIVTKITVEVVGVSTNSTTLRYNGNGSAKDARAVDGAVQYYNEAVANAGNTNSFDVWLKDVTKVQFETWAAAKARMDNEVQAAKINTILTTQPELLSAAQKNQLATIAALLP